MSYADFNSRKEKGGERRMKHVKVLSHEMPAQARVETAWVDLKNILSPTAGGALTATQQSWIAAVLDNWLRK